MELDKNDLKSRPVLKKIQRLSLILVLCVLLGCSNRENKTSSENGGSSNDTEMVVDSLLYFRHQAEQTDLLARQLPGMAREKAFSIQLDMLKTEQASGAQQIGWKMGGTATGDSASFDPMFGYILESNR